MLEVERVLDFACRPGKAHHQAPVAHFDGDRVGLRGGGGNFHFIMRSAVGDQRAIDHGAAPILAPAGNQQVFEQLIEGALEIAEMQRSALGHF